MTEYRCQIRDCQRPGTVLINFGEIPVMGAALCSRHKPTAAVTNQPTHRGVAVARMARWWRRGQPYRHAYRCGQCGWYPPGQGGYVRGVHDPKYVGHAFYCPARLYSPITTAAGLADQWAAISAWARASQAAALPGWEDVWRHMSWALVKRADMLGAEFPVADDPRELMAGVT